MSGRRHYFPDATSRSRGLFAAGGGSVAAIASAAVSRIAAHAVMTAMTNLRNIWSSPPCTAGVQERVLRHPRRPRHAGNIRQVTGTGRGQRTALTCCSSLYETQVTQRVPVIRKIFSIRSCVQAEELLQLTRGRLGGEPAVTGLLNRQVLNWHAEDRKARYTGKTVPSPNRNQDHPATANFRSDTPQGPSIRVTMLLDLTGPDWSLGSTWRTDLIFKWPGLSVIGKVVPTNYRTL